MNYFERIILGTAQIASNYGVNNRTKFHFKEKALILSKAFECGIRTLDTAIAYTKSEEVLGQIGVKDWHVITKIPTLRGIHLDKNVWLEDHLIGSLNRLKIDNLNAVLFHDPEQFRLPENKEIFLNLKSLQDKGLINKIGFSIYNLDQAFFLINNFKFQILQIPYNVFDRRFDDPKFNEICTKKNIEIHARSIFLQGLLLMDSNSIPKYFKNWKDKIDDWQSYLSYNNYTALDVCLSTVFNNKYISKVVIGIDNLEQMIDLINCLGSFNKIVPPISLSSSDLNLINPHNWRIK